ncbi:endospore germination permease [Neobacillus sp. NPDC097160]|uniref:GerAB/ArcD/ProY family transporter n=1 Tax=Neobacillus sp. NPDC097160 TaxID=3364298 RepID=UPI003818CF8D
MKLNHTIGVHQFTVLVIFFGVGTSILIAPASLAADAKQDAWISSIIGFALGVFQLAIYIALANRFPQKTLIEVNELVFGKWVGKIFSFFYISFFFVLCVGLLGDIGNFLTTEVLPETPIDFIMASLLVVVIFATRLGLVVIARGAEIFFPWVIFMFGLLVLMLVPQIELRKIQPVLENGFLPVLKAAFPFTSLQEFVVMMMLYPFVIKSQKTAKAFYFGYTFSGVVLIIIMLLCILVLGPGLTAENIYPSFSLAKKVNIANFFERVEVIIGGLWFITITFKLIITFYATLLGTSQLLRFKSYEFMTVPVAIFLIVTVLTSYTNIVFVMDFLDRVWPSYAYTFLIILPLLTLIMAWIGKKKLQCDTFA